eukprot:3424267-Alexandrium_andersonii.AAC.1
MPRPFPQMSPCGRWAWPCMQAHSPRRAQRRRLRRRVCAPSMPATCPVLPSPAPVVARLGPAARVPRVWRVWQCAIFREPGFRAGRSISASWSKL